MGEALESGPGHKVSNRFSQRRPKRPRLFPGSLPRPALVYYLLKRTPQYEALDDFRRINRLPDRYLLRVSPGQFLAGRDLARQRRRLCVRSGLALVGRNLDQKPPCGPSRTSFTGTKPACEWEEPAMIS